MFGLIAKLVVLSVCLQCCYLQPCNDDDGWFTMKQSCLKVYGDLQTFEGAKQQCENVSAQLMPFNTRTDYSVIYEKALEQRVKVWIGLKVQRISGDIVATSTDGTHVNISDPLVLDSFGEIPTVQEDSCMSLNRNIDGEMTFLFTRNLIDCNEMSGFVCQRPQDVCNVGWKIHRGICFKMFDGMHSWNLSSTLCQAKGAQLVKLSKPSDQRFFQKYIPEFDVLGVTSVWIGISDNMDDTGPLQWSDGSMILNFSYWAQTEPINTQGSQDCGYIDTSDKDGRWQTTTDCTQAKAFVCMIPANTPVKKVQMISEFGACHPEWILFNGNCYMFSEESYPWRSAQRVCMEEEADLAIITDDDDQAFINGHIQPYTKYWIGLTDVDQDGSWTWVDGSKATYTHLQFRRIYNADCVGVVGSLRGTWLNYICERHFNFICQKPADINSQPTVETTVISDVDEDTTKEAVSGKCGALWEERPNSDYCYQVHSEATSHQMAEFNCRQNNSTLVSIANSDEQNFLAGRLYWVNSESFWIGATDSLFEDGWTWSDGTPFAYVNWKPGKPDNVGSLKDCAAMLKGNSMWSDFDCSLEMSYICKKLGETVITNVSTTQASLSPGLQYGCPLGWMQFNDHCYLLISERENWAEANSKCRTNRAELTSINSQYENDFLGSRFRTDATSGWWTGLSNGRYYYTFEWSDDSTVQFTNWAVRHPVLSTGENCVVFIETKWHTADCDSQLPYVCKKKTGIVTQTSISPSQTGCPANTMAYDAFCYQFLDTLRLNWTDAEKTCSNQSQGHLAAINGIHAHLFLASELGSRTATSHYWIGLSDTSMPGDYVWSTGEKLLYAVWSSRYTGNQRGICVGIRTLGVAGQWDPLDCNNTRPFVCQFPRDGYTTTTTTVATTTQTQCLDGWQEFQGNCYRPFTSSNMRKSWPEARGICQSYGGDLVSISNQLVNDFVRTVFSSPQHRHVDRFWIGLSDLDKESAFKWSDGTVMSYAKWFSGEPNNYMGGEDCGEYYMSSSSWNDDSCYIPKYFLCSFPKGRQVPTLQPRTTAAALMCNEKDWFFKDGYCYFLSPTSGALAKKTWFEARRFCQENNADLASILSDDLNTFLVEYANKKELHKQNVWFGLHQINTDAFEWTDRSPYVYQNWRPAEPNNHLGSEKCGHMLSSDGAWNDDNCGKELYYFCKKLNGTKVINPTPTRATDASGGCPTGFSGLGSKCYAIRGLQNAQSSKIWSDAASDCNAMSSRNKVFLASITSPEEQAFIMTLLENSTRNIYIGLNDLHTRRLFTWQSGEEVRVTYWAEGMPGSGMGMCVVIQVDEVNFGRWKEVSCKDRYGYACQTLKDPNYPIEEPVQGNCKINYLQYRDSCYRPYTVPMQWSKAQKVCESDGGNLASISNVRELAKVHVLSYLKSGSNSAWIGMFFDKNSTLYKWVDDTPTALTIWDKGEPNMQFAGSCVSMANGVWSDNACSQAKHFVCKITSDAPSTTPAILLGETGYCENPAWIPFREYCYYAKPNDLVSWNDANLKCRLFRMDLLSLHSPEEQNFIMNLTKQIIYPKTNNGSSFGDNVPKNVHWTKHPANGKPWLGFRRDLTGGFRWSDNSQANFFAWHTGEPNNAGNGEDCVELLVNYGNWNDLPCTGFTRGYICKTKKIVPSTSAERREAVTTIKTSTLAKTLAATNYSSRISSALTAQPTTTVRPSTQPPTTASPSTQPTTTASPSTQPTTTVSPSTQPTTTVSPSTQPTTTVSPSTQPTTTVSPSTQPTTTVSPSTQPTTTVSPSTQPTTTVSPSTQPTTTVSPSTQPTTTVSPSTLHTMTVSPTTTTTVSPSTQPTTTVNQSTQPTTTVSQSTQPTTTVSQSTQPTTTVSQSTQPTTTVSQSTQPTTTVSPTTTTSANPSTTTTASPSTQPITTASPSTQPITIASPSTQPEMIDAVQSSHSAPKPTNGIFSTTTMDISKPDNTSMTTITPDTNTMKTLTAEYHRRKIGGGEIAGIVIGIITAVVIIGVVIYAVRRHLRNMNNPRIVDCMRINALYSPLEEHYF